MTEGPLLDRKTILSAFRSLATRLQVHGAVADVYPFGGGAMVVAFDEREATKDLDARFTSTSTVVREVHAVAEDMGLPRWWLNEQGTSYLPTRGDPCPVSVFDHPNLRVIRASDRYLLAMKAAASRRNTRDLEDIAALASRLGLETSEDVVRVHDEVFAGEQLPRAKVAVVREALRTASSERRPGGRNARCRVCGRLLRAKASVAAGVGPVCAARELNT